MKHLGTFELPVDALRTYPGNARRGDLNAIADSLRHNGQYRSLVVRADDASHPEAGGTIVAGNHTYLAAVDKLDWNSLRCDLLDCTEAHARRIVLVDNRLADKAKYDEDALLTLLQEASAADGLDGTGWAEDELAKLAGVLPEAGDADTEGDLESLYGVTVECDSEAQQADLLDHLSAEGWRVRALVR